MKGFIYTIATKLASIENSDKKILISVFFAVLLLIHITFAFAGFYNNDDIFYAKYASDIIYGYTNILPENHLTLRWGIIYSAAFFFKLFGINAFTSSLPSLLSFIGCIILLHKIILKERTITYFVVILIFCFSRSLIFYTHRLLPDPMMCFATLWMYFSYRKYFSTNTEPLKWGLHFAVAFLLAIITKETIIITLPLFLFYFLKDVSQRKYLQFWKYAFLFSIVFLGVYLLYFSISQCDFLFRYHLLITTNKLSSANFETITTSNKLVRVGYALWKAMLLNGDMIIYIPALLAFVYRNRINYLQGEKLDLFSFFFLMLCANFMTISFSHYIPLPEDPRHFIFLLPFASVLSGKFLVNYFLYPRKFILLPISLSTATIIMFLLKAGSQKYMFLSFAVFTIIIFLFQNKKRSLKLSYTVIGFALIFSLNYFIDFFKPVYPWYNDQKKIVNSFFVGKKMKGKIFTVNIFESEMNKYFLGFKTDSLNFLPIDSFKITSDSNLYYYLNNFENGYDKKIIDDLLKDKDSTSLSIFIKEKYYSVYSIDNYVLQILKDSSLNHKNEQ